MVQTNECFKGWSKENGNRAGRCCCNCKWQAKLVKHPWNKATWAKGSISEQMGWVCLTPELQPNVTFFDLELEHSVCECHEWKSNGQN